MKVLDNYTSVDVWWVSGKTLVLVRLSYDTFSIGLSGLVQMSYVACIDVPIRPV